MKTYIIILFVYLILISFSAVKVDIKVDSCMCEEDDNDNPKDVDATLFDVSSSTEVAKYHDNPNDLDPTDNILEITGKNNDDIKFRYCDKNLFQSIIHVPSFDDSEANLLSTSFELNLDCVMTKKNFGCFCGKKLFAIL